MLAYWSRRHVGTATGTRGLLAASAAVLMLGGCAQMDGGEAQLMLASAEPSQDASSGPPKSDLQRSLEHWGKMNAEKPSDLEASINYARALRAAGQKDQALAVLQQATVFNGNERKLASEFGRAALDMGRVGLAKRALEAADDPANPDWRVISARGTVMAKEGKYKDAIAFYERALSLGPNETSVLNNLALAHALNGDAEKAEKYLRMAEIKGGATPKVRQNLALVLNLQGKSDEARTVAASDVSSEALKSDAELVRKIVQREQKPSRAVASNAKTETTPSKTGWTASVASDAPRTTSSQPNR